MIALRRRFRPRRRRKRSACWPPTTAEILDYDDELGGGEKIKANVPYMVALATTAGTAGSEVGRSSVITDPVRRLKRIIFSPHMLASVVIADPELTAGLPPHPHRRHRDGCTFAHLRGVLPCGWDSIRSVMPSRWAVSS